MTDQAGARALEAALTAMLPPPRWGVGVVAIELVDPASLPIAEQGLIAGSVTERRREFAAGRTAARRALAPFTPPGTIVGRGHRGQPLWPQGIAGSIAHSSALAVAVTTRRTDDITSVGIDIETRGAVERELWSVLFTPREIAHLASSADSALAAAQLFTAKEAGFKALYPLLEAEIEFTSAEVAVGSTGTGTLTVAHPAVAPGGLGVRWAIAADTVCAAVQVAAGQVAAAAVTPA